MATPTSLVAMAVLLSFLSCSSSGWGCELARVVSSWLAIEVSSLRYLCELSCGVLYRAAAFAARSVFVSRYARVGGLVYFTISPAHLKLAVNPGQ